VMLGLALLGVSEASAWAEPSAIARVLYGVAAGIATGWLCGRLVARLVIHLRRRHQSALGMEEFLTLGLIALSYGLANAIHGIGFVAVFITGVAVRQTEAVLTGGNVQPEDVLGAVPAGEQEKIATDEQKAPAYMTEMVLGFNQQLEHIAEFAMVLLVGVLVSVVGLSMEGVLLAGMLFLVVRPVSVWLSLAGTRSSGLQLGLMGWFGIRGIGSLYYLVFALQYQWLPQLTQRFTSIVVTVIALSIVVHGISSTPLMDRYYKTRRAQRAKDAIGEQ
jgi:NhaP-type Na+/H+ or K+/H+ antiporter